MPDAPRGEPPPVPGTRTTPAERLAAVPRPERTGHQHGKGLPTTWSEKENLAWKTKLPGPGTSSPIVFGDRIYLTCYSGYNVPGERRGKQEDLKRHLVCLDRSDGKIVWDKSRSKAALPEQDASATTTATPPARRSRIRITSTASSASRASIAFTHEGKQVWHADVGDKTQRLGVGRVAGAVRAIW